MEHGKLAELIGWGLGFFVGGIITRIGWVRSRAGRGPLSILGNGEHGGNGQEKPVTREEISDMWQELGEVKLLLGELRGRQESQRHCDHCSHRSAS